MRPTAVASAAGWRGRRAGFRGCSPHTTWTRCPRAPPTRYCSRKERSSTRGGSVERRSRGRSSVPRSGARSHRGGSPGQARGGERRPAAAGCWCGSPTPASTSTTPWCSRRSRSPCAKASSGSCTDPTARARPHCYVRSTVTMASPPAGASSGPVSRRVYRSSASGKGWDSLHRICKRTIPATFALPRSCSRDATPASGSTTVRVPPIKGPRGAP
jgi:hypothetical protein